MPTVDLVYEFQVIASKGASADSVVQQAWRQAREMLGRDDFVLTVEIERRSGWQVSARAEATVEITDARDE